MALGITGRYSGLNTLFITLICQQQHVWSVSAALSRGICLFWLVSSASLATEPNTEVPTIQVAAPESLEMYGPLIAAVLRDAGTAPVLKFYPTARSRHLFVSGSVDAEFFRIAKLPADYPPDVIHIGPLQSVRFGMFIRANDPKLSGKPPDYLWQQELGYVRGTLAVETLIKSKNIANVEVAERASIDKMLLAGRFNVLIDSERLFLTHLMQTQNTDNITLAATVLEEPTYLLLHNKAKAHAPAIKQAVQRWLETGRWKREYQSINKLNGLPPDMSLVRYPPR